MKRNLLKEIEEYIKLNGTVNTTDIANDLNISIVQVYIRVTMLKHEGKLITV